MPQYYIEPAALASGDFTITGPEAEHAVRVMRLAPGAEITVFNGLGRKCRAEVTETARGELRAKITAELPSPKPALNINLYFAPVMKNDVQTILDSCTQLGVASFTPVITERCEHKITDKFETKSEAWRRTLLAACKQCGRADMPEIHPPLPLRQAVKTAGQGVIGLLTAGVTPLAQAVEKLDTAPGGALAVFIGPEGGFSEAEAASAVQAGLLPVTLGVHTLRAETACAAACAALCSL